MLRGIRPLTGEGRPKPKTSLCLRKSNLDSYTRALIHSNIIIKFKHYVIAINFKHIASESIVNFTTAISAFSPVSDLPGPGHQGDHGAKRTTTKPLAPPTLHHRYVACHYGLINISGCAIIGRKWFAKCASLDVNIPVVFVFFAGVDSQPAQDQQPSSLLWKTVR